MKRIIIIPIILFVLIIIAQIGYWDWINSSIESAEARGLFGDSFGALTSLFSGLAFAGMIYAIILQSRELSLQRQELLLTREELAASRKEQAKAAEAQAELVEKQVLTARITGLSAIVQGRYQYAAALGHNSAQRLRPVNDAEFLLLEALQEVGCQDTELLKNK